jgi:hypothetical protein
MYLAVKNARAVDDYKLMVTFENDENRIFDMAPYLNVGKFAELKNKSLFRSVRVNFDSIEWGNRLDLDPEFLYQKSMKI